MCHQETESLWSQLDWCQLVCGNTQLLRGQVAASPQLSSKLPPAVAAVTLHGLWCDFGDTVNGAKTEDRAATTEPKWKALLLKRLTSRWSVSPDILLLLFEYKTKQKKLVFVAAGRKSQRNQ